MGRSLTRLFVFWQVLIITTILLLSGIGDKGLSGGSEAIAQARADVRQARGSVRHFARKLLLAVLARPSACWAQAFAIGENE
jgi:hypothetical protein